MDGRRIGKVRVEPVGAALPPAADWDRGRQD